MTGGVRRIWYPVVLRELEVLRVIDLTPRMRRVTLGGVQLGAFHAAGRDLTAFHTGGFDDHVKVFFSAPGETDPVLPAQDDGHLDWPHAGPRPIHRDYTVRRFDPDQGELDLDVVLHPGGVAPGWAATAASGSRLHLAGPKLSHLLPAAGNYLLVGDETALPAIARWAEEIPSGAVARAVVEVADAAEEQPLDPRLTVTWVHRDAGGRLLPAVRALELSATDTVAWVAGEAGTVRRLRTHLVCERAIAPERVHAAGYWRRGAAGDELDDRPARLLELTDLLTPYAIRLAVTLGIPERLAGGPRGVDELAACCGTEAHAIRSLLRVLAAREILAETRPGVFGVAALGEPLLDPELGGALDLDGAAGHLDRAWAGLPHAVSTGTAGYPAVFGTGFWDHLDADPTLAASFDHYLGAWADQWVPEAAAALAARGASHVVDVGGGTGALLTALLAADPDARGTLVEQPDTAARARATLAEAGLDGRCRVVECSLFDPLPADGPLYVLAQVLHDWPDDAAVAILRGCADAVAADGRIVLVERVLDEPQPRFDHLVMDLRMLVLFGARERSRTELTDLALNAGLTLIAVSPLGSGLSAVELAPRAVPGASPPALSG